MPEQRVVRRLAVILAADSRLTGQDAAESLARVKALRRELINSEVGGHNDRIVKATGNGDRCPLRLDRVR